MAATSTTGGDDTNREKIIQASNMSTPSKRTTQ
jgi:hypothetical protein